MRIVYIAKHDSGGNDDEGAISHALAKLGHRVIKIQEREFCLRYKQDEVPTSIPAGDFILFHGLPHPDLLSKVRSPKVCWYFDLIEYPNDPSLATRLARRQQWIKSVEDVADLVFLTDGDWVNKRVKEGSKKVVVLRQGADERMVGIGDARVAQSSTPEMRTKILFTGLRSGGDKRDDWVSYMHQTYGALFKHIPFGMHGVGLRNLIAAHCVIVAPDHPATDNYWSNRVYLTLGFGGCLIHPHCLDLGKDYEHDKHIIYYNDRSVMYSQVWYALQHPDYAKEIGRAALEHTKEHHTYRHRCQSMLNAIKERFNVS
jgi:hypothetical protein